MKTKKEVLSHLIEVGYTKRAVDKICAYLIAKDLKAIDERILIKRGDNDFNGFVEWFNSKCAVVEPKYKVGDWVRVVDCGKAYVTYEHKFKELGFKNKGYNDIERSGVCGKVFGISKHGFHDEILYAVDLEDGKQCLISEDGIEEYIYKVGDYAKVVKKGLMWNSNGKMDYIIGRVIKITEATKGRSIVMEPDSISKYGWAFIEEELEPSTKEAYEEQCKQDVINKAADDFYEWRKLNGDITVDIKGRDDKFAEKILSYGLLCLFAQWQNTMNNENELNFNLFIDDETDKVDIYEDECECSPLCGCIYFNSKESAQLAIDVLGEDSIRKALI